MLLVKFESNWADEFDCFGFSLMTQDEWDQHKKDLKKVEWPIERYFGTNECFLWESEEDYLDCFEIKNLTPEETKTISKLFDIKLNEGQHQREWGQFCLVETEDC